MTDLTKEALGQRIRSIRTRLKKTQEEFGKMLPTATVTGATISAYENGDIWPSLPVIGDICKIGGISFQRLLAGREAEATDETPEQEEERLLQAFRRMDRDTRKALLLLAER